MLPWGILGASRSNGQTYELISTNVLGSGATSVTFSSIPGTYKHLQLRVTGRQSTDSNHYAWIYRFNSDSGNNYAMHQVFGQSPSMQYENAATQSSISTGWVAPNITANSFAANVIDILNYANTTDFKTMRFINGYHGSFARIYFGSGLWRSTSAISSITISNGGGVNFVAGSRFSLYGVRG